MRKHVGSGPTSLGPLPLWERHRGRNKLLDYHVGIKLVKLVLVAPHRVGIPGLSRRGSDDRSDSVFEILKEISDDDPRAALAADPANRLDGIRGCREHGGFGLGRSWGSDGLHVGSDGGELARGIHGPNLTSAEHLLIQLVERRPIPSLLGGGDGIGAAGRPKLIEKVIGVLE